MTTENVTKRCSACKVYLPVERFHLNRSHSDGLASYCKECTKAASRRHYEQNKQSYFDRNQEVRRRQKERLLDLKKNTPCHDCGQKFHPFIMEFDHFDPANKLFSIGKSGRVSDKQLREEMAKCNLVCANCHKLRTFRRHQQNPRYVLAGLE